MRSFPRTPVAQMLTIAGIAACLVMLFVSTLAGFVIMVVALAFKPRGLMGKNT